MFEKPFHAFSFILFTFTLATPRKEAGSLSVTNSMGNINNVATDADTLELVYGNRIKQMRLRFAKHFDKTIERANRR